MSGAKLIKKHELDMGSVIKNGKERTNYIIAVKLLCIAILSLLFVNGQSVIASEKTWVIVIDAGHGGKDPGAIGSISKEKNINLAIALKTGEYLEQNLKNVRVLYTRKTDVFMELRDRPEFANKNKADLFISIHSNWISKSSIKGTETWIMGPAQDDENLEVAMKENEVILLEDDFSTKYEGFDPKSPESYIMFTVMQNTFKKQSTWLASNIQSQFKNRAGRVDRGVKQAGFWVLYMTTMPSVLIETGFITNSEEEKFLVSKEGQDYIASAIFRAARDYINEIDKKSQISTSADADTTVATDTSEAENIPVADELRFMIQITSSTEKKELKPENFKGIKDVKEISLDSRFRYTTGSFTDYFEAVEYRKKITTLYPDAFVIAVKNDKVLPLQEALNSKQ
jgi:N-acetylmuramoyl-L-alanine amidase